MGGKSIAARATSFKQRHTHIKMPEAFKQDKEGNALDKEINTKVNVCLRCGHKFWFRSVRCPECNGLQN